MNDHATANAAFCFSLVAICLLPVVLYLTASTYPTKQTVTACVIDASEERRNGRNPNAQIVLASHSCRVVRVINGTALDLVFDY